MPIDLDEDINSDKTWRTEKDPAITKFKSPKLKKKLAKHKELYTDKLMSAYGFYSVLRKFNILNYSTQWELEYYKKRDVKRDYHLIRRQMLCIKEFPQNWRYTPVHWIQKCKADQAKEDNKRHRRYKAKMRFHGIDSQEEAT